MPLFEYRCKSCNQSFEVLVTSRTATEVSCPQCKATDIERLLGLPAAGKILDGEPATNCRGDGPPCGAPWCGRKS
jgi:putative FmdB family regulatory protein